MEKGEIMSIPDLHQRIKELEAASDFDHSEYKRLRNELRAELAAYKELMG